MQLSIKQKKKKKEVGLYGMILLSIRFHGDSMTLAKCVRFFYICVKVSSVPYTHETVIYGIHSRIEMGLSLLKLYSMYSHVKKLGHPIEFHGFLYQDIIKNYLVLGRS